MFSKSRAICFLVFLLIRSIAPEVKCVHEPPNPNDARDYVEVGPREDDRLVKRAADSVSRGMKFEMTYEKTTEVDQTKRDYVVNTLMPEAVEYFEKLLKVRKPMKFLFARKCKTGNPIHKNFTGTYCENGCDTNQQNCNKIPIPEKHLAPCFTKKNGKWTPEKEKPDNETLDVDYFFYVAIKETDRCNTSSSTIAYASTCGMYDDSTGRPLAGYFIMCPKHVKTELRKRHDVVSTIKHEMMHALGFSYSFKQFRKRDGTQYTDDERIKIHTFTDWWTRTGLKNHTVTYLTTPAVVAAARIHFNCPTLTGAELENQGGDGTKLTHWEKRIFENEAMTGVESYSGVFSNVTLALFHDTGWYDVNFNMSEKLAWGYKRGCEFVLKSCGQWIKNRTVQGKSVAPYCNNVRVRMAKAQCSEDGTFVAKCNLERKDIAPDPEYQYFDKIKDVELGELAYYGGRLETADFCPIPTGFDWMGEDGISQRDSKCLPDQNEGPPKDNSALETTGIHSKCFEHGGEKLWHLKQCYLKQTAAALGAGCYPILCKDGFLWFSLLNGTVEKKCLKAGHVIDIRRNHYRWLHVGSIICPSCEDYCPGQCNSTNDGEPDNTKESDLFERIPCAKNSASIRINLVVFSLFIATFTLIVFV